jgi:hypothetical protein
MVDNYRRMCAVPERVSGKELFDVLESCRGMEQPDIIAEVMQTFVTNNERN